MDALPYEHCFDMNIPKSYGILGLFCFVVVLLFWVGCELYIKIQVLWAEEMTQWLIIVTFAEDLGPDPTW